MVLLVGKRVLQSPGHGMNQDLSSAGLWGPSWGQPPPPEQWAQAGGRGGTPGGQVALAQRELGGHRPEGTSQGCAPPHALHPGSGAIFRNQGQETPWGGGSVKSGK